MSRNLLLVNIFVETINGVNCDDDMIVYFTVKTEV